MSLADSDNNDTLSEAELNSLTKAQLLAYATELGIEGLNNSMLKADIVSAILNR